MFLDDTACNLASLNLMQFRKGEGVKNFDVAAFEHGVRLWTMLLEISRDDGAIPLQGNRPALL